MKAVHLVAGAGGMYCGSCLHGNTLAAALRRAGCDALLVPAYTPIRTDEENVSGERIVYGGVNVYLQQVSPLFRHMPPPVDRLLDRPALIRRLARRGSTTRPEDLGPLCVSMLRGEEGRQRKELDKLVDWLAREVRPDIVHLNNALMAGMARHVTRRLGVPVVADLSGEDSFVEKLPEPHYSQVRALLRERSADLAAMVAMNGYFADFMAEYLAVARERIQVIPPGLDLRDFPSPGTVQGEPTRAVQDPVTVGFLGRVCADKGLHLLAEAFAMLAGEPDLPPVQLAAAGYLARADRPYLAEIEGRVRELGLADRFCYRGELDRAGKIVFLRSLDLLSAPAVYRESKGLPVLEAWAAGVPVVVPEHGAFPELIADTGGGLLHAPHDAAALAAALRRMIRDPALAHDCACGAQRAVHERYHAALMAERTMELYKRVGVS